MLSCKDMELGRIDSLAVGLVVYVQALPTDLGAAGGSARPLSFMLGTTCGHR
jgi:hypothetical protein